jgi:uncharacterized protein (DUF3820 family)
MGSFNPEIYCSHQPEDGTTNSEASLQEERSGLLEDEAQYESGSKNTKPRKSEYQWMVKFLLIILAASVPVASFFAGRYLCRDLARICGNYVQTFCKSGFPNGLFLNNKLNLQPLSTGLG